MAKISRYGGPSYVLAEPGEIVEDGLNRPSAHHPDEQGAFPLVGEGDDGAWLTRDPEADDGIARDDDGEPVRGKAGETVEREGEDVSPGDNSSPSREKQPNSDEKNSDDDPKPASPTGNLFSKDEKPEASTADSAAKSTTSRSRK